LPRADNNPGVAHICRTEPFSDEIQLDSTGPRLHAAADEMFIDGKIGLAKDGRLVPALTRRPFRLAR
jgi:hypothetical protein